MFDTAKSKRPTDPAKGNPGSCGPRLNQPCLEDDFGAELQATASNAIGIDVGGAEITVAAVGVKSQAPELIRSPNVGAVHVYVRNAEPLMVEQVERLGLQLNGKVFGDLGVFKYGQVDGIDRLATLCVPAYAQERRSKKLLGRDVVHDPADLACSCGSTGGEVGDAAVCGRCIVADADRIERCACAA